MNKNRYRVIYSQARGIFIAVAEIVKSRTKNAGQSEGSTTVEAESTIITLSYKKINPLNFAVISLLGAVIYTVPLSSIADSQIVSDKIAPTSQQATILNSSNGLVQVNIQTPSAGGVSRNTYTQFDVGQEGAILNNSRNNVQTQIGGWVQGNPWLAKGEAKVILNEVNSSNPSQLKGYLEVAGKSAQVVIANPSGLVCDGCGVINADRFTLTTGQAVMNQGYLESFRVREGQVTIEGKGLNGSLTPYTDIYARALQVNAGLYANELNTVLGQNDILVKDQVQPQVTAVTGTNNSNPPASGFALDVGQLGGMYAGKIYLVGTEQGLGVRNAGSLNTTTGQFTLNANGDLVNTGNIIANKDKIAIQVQNVKNSGNISSSTSKVTIQSQNLDNSGLISTSDELHLQNQNGMTNTGKLNAARIVLDSDSLKNSGSIEQTGIEALDLKAGEMSNLDGKIGISKTTEASGTSEPGAGEAGTTAPIVPVDPSKDGGSLGVVTTTENGTPKNFDTGYIHVNNEFNNDNGAIVANGGVDLDSSNGLNNQGGQLNLGTVNIKGENFNNDQGKLTVSQAEIQTHSFSNQAGVLSSNQKLNIQTDSTNNQKGKIQSVDQLDLNITGNLNNIEGQIASNIAVNVNANNINNTSGVIYSEEQGVNVTAKQNLDNTSGLIQAKFNLNLNSQALNNTSGEIVADHITQTHSSVNNTKGLVIANQNLTSSVQQFDNTLGQIQAEKVQLQHQQLTNSGSIYAEQDLNISGIGLQNIGSLTAGKNVNLNSLTIQQEQPGLIAAGLDREGKLSDAGDVTIQSDQVVLHGQTLAGNDLSIQTQKDLDVSKAQLQAKKVTLTSKTGNVSTEASTVVAQNQLNITSQKLINNHQGQLSSQELILTGQQLDNSQGKIQHIGTNDFNLNFVNGLNNQAGEIQSNANNVNLKTSAFNNESGKLTHAGKQQLNISVDQLVGSQGQILSNGELDLTANKVGLDGAITSADQINITANSLSHQKGQMVQSGDKNPLSLNIANELNNLQGVIATQKGLNIQAGSANNQSGQLSSGQSDLNLTVKNVLDNSNAGQIVSGKKSDIQAGSINNSQNGKISALDSLSISSQNNLNNQAGQIVANQDISITSNGLDNSSGQIGSAQSKLDLEAGSGFFNNTSGTLQAEKDLKVQADSILNQSGLINSQSTLTLNSQKDINNTSGQIIAKQDVDLTSLGLNNMQGQIGSVEGNVTLGAGTGNLNNQSGKIQSAQDLNIKAQNIDNQSGLILAQKQLVLNNQGLNNQKGQIQSGDAIAITSKNLNNQSGTILTNADLTLNIDGTVDNSQAGTLSGVNTKIKAEAIDNSGKGQINAKDTLNISTKNSTNNQTGSIVANQDVTIQSQGLDNTSGQIGSVQGQLKIDAGQGTLQNTSGSLQTGSHLDLISNGLINDSGNIIALGDSSILSLGDLSNVSGQIASNSVSKITAQNLTNQAGKIQSGDQANLNLTVNGTLDNSQAGQIHSGNNINMQTIEIDNSDNGQINAQNALSIKNLGHLNNLSGKIFANQIVDIQSQGIKNDQGQIGSLKNNLKLDAGNQSLSNVSGLIQAKSNLSINANSIENISGQISTQEKLDLISQQAINNLEGLIAADLGLTLISQGLNNNRGQIGSAQGDVELNAGSGLLSNQTGIVLSGKALKLNADQVDNSNKGQINSQTDLEIIAVKDINNQSGVIASTQQLSLKSQGVNNNAGQIASINSGVDIDSGSGAIENNSGVIQAQNDIQLKSQQLNSHSGKISSEKAIELNIEQAINNSAGQIVANEAIAIQSQGLNNDQGKIASIKEHLTIDAGTGVLSNQSGSLQSAKDIQLKADRLDSQSGLINAQGSIQAQVQQGIDNTAGQIIANQSVQLNSQGLNNTSGQIGSVESILKINVGQGVISNQQGKLQSKQDLSLKAQGIDNQSGLIATQENLVLGQQWLKNNTGQVISGESLNLTGQDLNNQGGLLQSGRDLSFKLSGKLDNSQSGQLISGDNTQIDVQQLENSQQGLINAQGSLSIETQQDINNNAGIIVSNKFVDIQSQGLDNSQGQLGSVKEQVTINTGKGAFLNQSGTLQSTGDLSVHSTGLNNNKGTLNSLGKVSLSNDGNLNNEGGQIASNGQLEITANDLSNQSGLIQTGDKSNLNLKLGGALSNQTGQIHSGSDQQITAQSIDNSVQGQMTAQGKLNIQSQAEINNQTGKLIANDLVEIKGEGVNNTKGQIGSLQDQVLVHAGQGALINQSGTIQAKQDLSVTAQSVDNQSGQMNSQGQLQLTSQQAINNLEGLIAADLGLKLNSHGLNNNRGQIGSAQGDVELNADSGVLSNQAGVVLSSKALKLNAGQVDNSNKGQINSQADLEISTLKDINNQGGVIASNQQLVLKSQGLNNDAGQIGSVLGQIQLDAGQLRLENQQGLIQSAQGINIVANGVNNAQGQMNSKNLLQIDSQEQLLDNSQGTLSSENIKIDSGQLNNHQGLVQAQQTIQIDTHNQDLINTNSGQQTGILSQSDIQLSNIKTLNNTDGYLASAKDLGIQVNQVLNHQGTILAGKQLNIGGIGQNQLLNNQSGQLSSMGGMTLNIDRINNNGKLEPNNANSHIMAVGDLNITTQQLDNQNTLTISPTDTSTQGIDANNLNITANILNNQTGAIRSSGNQNLNIHQILNNQLGQISSEKQLTILGNELDVNNLNGQILSGTRLNLTAKYLSGNGKVLSLGDAQINLKESYIHSIGAQLQANQNLSLITQGNIANYGTINSGNRLDLNAVNINNMVDAKIESHETRLLAQNELNNTGLINGDYTRLKANTLNNQGMGRIYGTTLAINANTLNNQPNSAGVAPVIASRGDMHLGVQVLNNLANTADYASQSLIFSAGNLYLGGGLDTNDKAIGQALVINNESATIESLGNMRLSATQINNINKNFNLKDVKSNPTVNVDRDVKTSLYYDAFFDQFRPFQIITTTTTTDTHSRTEVGSSAPAKIIAGGNLDLVNSSGVNDKSYIFAGQTLTNDGSIKNIGAFGEEKVLKHEVVEQIETRFGSKKKISDTESLNVISTFDLGVGQKEGNQSIDHNQISITTVSQNQSNDEAQSSQLHQTNINGLKNTNNSTQVEQAKNYQGENLNVKNAVNTSNDTKVQTAQQNLPSQQSKNLDVDIAGEKINVTHADQVNDQTQKITETEQVSNTSQVDNTQFNSASIQSQDSNVSIGQISQQQGTSADVVDGKSTSKQLNAIDKVDDAIQYEIRTVNSASVKVTNNALYRINVDSKASYLIETDPNFTNFSTWLSSDYMLDILGVDPALQQKRLGDGFYEQRMIQDQIAHLTGYRFLEGFANDEDQYKSLMSNGASFAKLYGLRPGVALTAAQIAQLTSDIVWLVEQDVKLPDGTLSKALVPQVYVKARVGDLKGDGSLISANNINFKLDGNLINSATLAGREAVHITAQNVENLNGRIQGNQIGIETKNNLNNIGGRIEAKDAMALKVDGDLNVSTTTIDTENNLTKYKSQSTTLDRVAGLYVSGSKSNVDKPTLVIDVAGNTLLNAAEIKNNNGATILNTAGNINIGSVSTSNMEKWITNPKNTKQVTQQKDVGSEINGVGSIVINAQNITGKTVNITSQVGNIELSAQKDITLENGLDQSSTSIKTASKGSFGRKKSSTYDENITTSIANQLDAGQNIIINSKVGDITATHLVASAGDNIQIHAQQGNVDLLSAIDEKSVSKTTSKSNFATYKNRQTGSIDQEVAQTQLTAGKNVDINAGKNIELQANDVQAGQSIYVGNTQMQRQADGTLKSADGSLMPENVTLSTLETHDQQWDEQQKGYRGIVKDLVKATAIGLAGVEALAPGLKVGKITVGESKSSREEQTQQTGTSLAGENVYVGSAGQTTLTSADITAKNTIISGQKVTLNAAEEQNISTQSQSKETIEGLGVKLNKDNIRLGGFIAEDATQSTKTTETTHKAGLINTENLKIQGADGIDILGQNIKATGDTVLDHGRGDLNIGGYENKTTVEDKTHTETISAEVGVRNAYLDAALAVGAVKDAAEAVKQAKDQYSQAQRDYASGKITKEALDDTKANVAMATANLANAQIAVGAAAATAAASSATYGFTIGANGERIETTSTTNTEQGKWQGSQLDLNNLTLKSEGQDVNIQGSRLTATGTTTFDGTKDVNVTAGTEHGQQDTSSKTNSQSVSYTYGGGGSASVGKQTSKAHDESLTHVNSEVDLNKVSGSINKLNIQGGEVSIADRGDLNVNEIHVESLQDTASGTSSSKGGSVGAGFGSSGLSNVTASYNQAKGENDKAWVNETSKLLIGNAQNDANLDAMGVKNVTNIGGVIANATKNSEGTLTDHGKLNYTGALELKDIQDHSSESNRGFNASTSVGTSIKGESQESSFHPSGSTTVGLQSTGNEKEQLTKATMGQGNIAQATANTNRDINNTQEITRDQVTGMLDASVTIDNRLLTESGRSEIIQQQKDLPKNLKQATQQLKNDVENLALKLPDSKIQNKIITSLNQMVGGEMIAEAYKEFLKNGGTKEEFFVVADNAYAQQYIKDLADTNEKIKELESKGYSLEQILNTDITSVGDTNVISVKGEHNVTLTKATTIGMQLLAASYGLSKSYSDFQQELNEKYGVAIDPETLSLVIGTILTGPAKTVANTLLSSQYGEYIQKAKDKSIDFVSTSITAISYGTNTNVISTYTDSELKDQISQESVETQEWSKSARERKEGAKFLTNIIAGIVVGGVGKGVVKGKDSDIDISKSGGEFEIGGAKKDAQGLYHDEKGRFTSDPNKVETDLTRPSLRADTKREINERYDRTEDGKYIDPVTEKVIEPPYHYGHIYGSEHRRLTEAAEKVGMTQKQFNDYVNSRPDKFKIENATENLSHKGEKPGRGELKEILDDMQLFLKGRDK